MCSSDLQSRLIHAYRLEGVGVHDFHSDSRQGMSDTAALRPYLAERRRTKIDGVHRNRWRTFGAAVTFVRANTEVIFERLRKQWQGQEMVGILLPPSVPGALVNYAAMLMGKVPVNLNYTVSNETLASCAQQCNLKAVVTARVFLERVKIQPPGETIFIEDVAKGASFGERAAAALAASL